MKHKIMKHSIKKTTKRTGMALLFLATIATTITSCGKDDDSTPDNNGEEKETAYIKEVFNSTPNGAIFYLDITDDLKSTTDLSKAVELGINVSVYSIGEYPITVNSTAKTITKWKVNKRTLEPSVDAVLSYASTGANSTDITFVSDTAAFINDLGEGKIVEFNPTTMELTKTHNTTPLSVPSNFSYHTLGKVYNGKIIFPIQWLTKTCCDYPTPLKATVGIFDPATGTLNYDTDERAIGLNSDGLLIDGDNAYVVPAFRENNWIKEFYGASPSPFIVLKLNDDGTINDEFITDLLVGLPEANLMRSSFIIQEGKFAFTYSENDLGSFDDRLATSSAMEYKQVLYDLNTNETAPFTLYDDKYTYLELNRTLIDGEQYVRAWYYPSESASYYTDLLTQQGLETTTVVSTIEGGGVSYIEKLW